MLRFREHGIGLWKLDQLAQPEQTCVIGHARGLLHVVGDDDDGVILFEFGDQLLHAQGGDRVERGCGLVHQDHFGLRGNDADDTWWLLLAQRELQRASFENAASPSRFKLTNPNNPLY